MDPNASSLLQFPQQPGAQQPIRFQNEGPTPFQIAHRKLAKVVMSDEFNRATEAQRHEAVEKLLEPDSLLRYSLEDLLRKRDRSINWAQVIDAFSDDGDRTYLKIRPKVMLVDEIETDVTPHLEDRLRILSAFTSKYNYYKLIVHYQEAFLRKVWVSNSSIIEMWIADGGSFVFVFSSPDAYLVISSIGGHAGIDLSEFSYAHSHGEDMIEIDLTELNLEQLKVFVAVKAREYIKDAMQVDTDGETIQVGDVVLIEGDLHEKNRYQVLEIGSAGAKLQIIDPSEDVIWVYPEGLRKAHTTKEEVIREWRKSHGSGD